MDSLNLYFCYMQLKTLPRVLSRSKYMHMGMVVAWQLAEMAAKPETTPADGICKCETTV